MDENVKKFLEEMDELTKEGVFGEEPKLYAYLREGMDLNSFFIKIFVDWLEDRNQVGKENVHKIISLLLEIYCDAFKINPTKTIEILAYFIDGFPGVPHSDIATPLYNWFQSLINWRESLPTGKNPGSSFQVAQNTITVYQKGVELVNRILVVLISLKCESRGDEYLPNKLFDLPLFKKIEKFVEIFENKYYFIINFSHGVTS